jgi:hypothetical protein
MVIETQVIDIETETQTSNPPPKKPPTKIDTSEPEPKVPEKKPINKKRGTK